jgi:hypothetical protein
VLRELAEHVGADGKSCHPGIRRLAALVQANHELVGKILGELGETKLLTRTRQRRSHGQHRTYDYELDWNAIAALPWNGVTMGPVAKARGVDSDGDPYAGAIVTTAEQSRDGPPRNRAAVDGRGTEPRQPSVVDHQCETPSTTDTASPPLSAPTTPHLNQNQLRRMGDQTRDAVLDQFGNLHLIEDVDRAVSARFPYPDAVTDAWYSVGVAVTEWNRHYDVDGHVVEEALATATRRLDDGHGRAPSYVGVTVSRFCAAGLGHDGERYHEDVVAAIVAALTRRSSRSA